MGTTFEIFLLKKTIIAKFAVTFQVKKNLKILSNHGLFMLKNSLKGSKGIRYPGMAYYYMTTYSTKTVFSVDTFDRNYAFSIT